MELLCCESEHGGVVRAETDPSVTNSRVLEQLLLSENQYVISSNYFTFIQKEITPSMRKICASWMMEVCEEEKCEDSVFPSAINYMDRFLAQTSVHKAHLQLLGCVCLLVASKVRQTSAINPKRLASYTDNTYTATEILQWEVLVLQTIQWDTASVIAIDFLDIILPLLPLSKNLASTVRKHSVIFSQLCATEFEFSLWTASLVILGCVGAAINGLQNAKSLWKSAEDLVNTFHEITAIERDFIRHCIQQVENVISAHVLEVVHLTAIGKTSMTNQAVPHPAIKTEQYSSESHLDLTSENLPETPTDLQDVVIDDDPMM